MKLSICESAKLFNEGRVVNQEARSKRGSKGSGTQVLDFMSYVTANELESSSLLVASLPSIAFSPAAQLASRGSAEWSG